MNENSTQPIDAGSDALEPSTNHHAHTYNGWLVSNNVIKRAVAVFLHSLLGQLIIVLPLIIITSILGFLVVGINL